MRSFLFFVMLSGCATYTDGLSPREVRCARLFDGRTVWSAASKGAAAIAGAQGLALIPVNDDDARMGLAIGVALAGAIAVVAGVVADGRNDSFDRECTPLTRIEPIPETSPVVVDSGASDTHELATHEVN